MRCARAWFIVCACVVLGASDASVGQGQYTLVEWPAPATSAAGFASPWNLIQASAVAMGPKGTVLVLHRGAHPVLEFDTAGKFIRSWGDGLFSEGKVAGIPKNNWAPDRSRYSAVYGPAGCTSCGAHSIRVDPQGNIWLVDATAHVIYKTNPDGKEIMRLGTKGTSGASQTTFNLPTDVAFAANGDLYVTDGYGGARVVKFSRDGKYLLEWGKRGTGPGEFGLPHNVVVDEQGQVYVTDRDNQRIQVFDPNGKFLTRVDRHRRSLGTGDDRRWTHRDRRRRAGFERKRRDEVARRGRRAWRRRRRRRKYLSRAAVRRHPEIRQAVKET